MIYTLKKYSHLEKGDVFLAQDGQLYFRCGENKSELYNSTGVIEFVVFHGYSPVLFCEEVHALNEEECLEDKLLKKLFLHTYKSSRPYLAERGLEYHHIQSLYNELLPFIITELMK